MTAIFDTHAHLIADDWERYPPRPLRADLPPPARTDYTMTTEALIGWMDEQGVASSCVVQRGHLYGYDNSYIIEAGQRYPGRLLPVVILDTQDPGTPATLTRLARDHGVRGLRMANTRPAHLDTSWMASPAALDVWRTCADLCLPVAIIFFQNQLPWTLPLLRYVARLHPQLPILIDHIGVPWGASIPELNWARESGIDIIMPAGPDFGIAATIGIFDDTPNVHFKFTEINVERMLERGADPGELVYRVADRFGADRLVWGSDVGQSLRWPYPAKVEHARTAAAHLDQAARTSFLHGNAARIYRHGS